MKNKIIKLDKINKIYENGIQAVFDLSLEIQNQEFIALVGPSGCGKSTTLRMIAGLEDISYGELFFDEEVMNAVSSKNRDIAMVFQNYALYPHMNVYENIAFSLKTRKHPSEEINEKVEWAAKILDLNNYLNRKPKDLSGGQRQRVALGRAIVRNPRLFLMDEPLSNLDAKLRSEMRTEIKELHKKLKSTTIYVTHDQIEAMTMADRIVVMKEGFVQQIGTPSELFDSPSNIFVAKFIGSPEINLFKGKITKDNYFVSNNKGVKIKIDKSQLPKNINNNEVIMGIRPYDVSNDDIIKSTYKSANLKIKITAVENLGIETICYGKINENDKITFISKGRYSDFKYGQETEVYFNMSKILFFDAKTETNIMSDLNSDTINALKVIQDRNYDFQIKNDLLEKQANKKTFRQLIYGKIKSFINQKNKNEGEKNA